MADGGGGEGLVVATWNVNSIKVRLAHVLDWIEQHQPDVLALQEIKTVADDFPQDAFAARGYQAAVHGQKTYNGVALLTRRPLEDVQRGIPEHAGDEQARIVSGVVHGLRIVDVYVPNGQAVGSDKYAYKLQWLAALERHIAGRHRPDEPLVVLGDFNIAPEPRDVYDPDLFAGEVLFSDAERASFARLVAWGFTDLFRRFHDAGKLYSWWDYRMGAFRRNLGARIDHILVTSSLAERALSCEIDKAPRKLDKPSDHAPVVARFAI